MGFLERRQMMERLLFGVLLASALAMSPIVAAAILFLTGHKVRVRGPLINWGWPSSKDRYLKLRVEIWKEGQYQRGFSLTPPGPHYLGRQEIDPENMEISRTHLLVEYKGGSWRVTDLSSTNSTRLGRWRMIENLPYSIGRGQTDLYLPGTKVRLFPFIG